MKKELFKFHRYYEMYLCHDVSLMKLQDFPIKGYFSIHNETDWAVAQSFMFSIGYLWRTERVIKYVEYSPDKVTLIWDQTGMTFTTTLNWSLLDELRLYEVRNMYHVTMPGRLSGMRFGL